MSFLNPLALWFGLLAAPIIILYLLKIRRKEVEVSSTLLWRMALRDRQANAPWQKLRRNLLLLLQLVILALMVLAVARLAFPVRSIAGGSVVLLIDGSASMLAEDVAPNRFAQAIAAAEGVVRAAGAGTTASAILVTNQPVILFSGETDPDRAGDILAQARPVAGEVDWGAALSLAAGLRPQAEGAELTYVLISDGGVPEEGLPPLPGKVQYVAVGRSDDNLAISALSVRAVPAGGSAELFLRVANYGSEDRAAVLTIARNGETLLTEQMQLPAQSSRQFVIPDLPNEAARYEARLSNLQANLPLDSFALDDAGYTVLAPSPVRRVLLVSTGNLFLERLLLLLPNLQASRTVPDENGEVRLPTEAFDLYIFDGLIPGGELPDGQILLVAPPENELFVVDGDTRALEDMRVTDHPLAQYLEWGLVHVFETRQITAPAWAQVLVETDATPLVFVGEQGGRRVAVVGFDLHESDLPLQIAFPILFSNLLEYLAPRGMIGDPNATRPNQAVTLEVGAGATRIVVTGPDGEETNLTPGDPEILFNGTGNPGFYTLRVEEAGSLREEVFAVNPFSEVESRIALREQVQVGQTAVATSAADEISSRETWTLLIVLAVAFLMVEWLAYHRRLGGKSWLSQSG